MMKGSLLDNFTWQDKFLPSKVVKKRTFHQYMQSCSQKKFLGASMVELWTSICNFETTPTGLIAVQPSEVVTKLHEAAKRGVIPDGIYRLKVNNRNTRTMCKICSKYTIKFSI